MEDKYIELAEAMSDLVSLESTIHNKRRLAIELKAELNSKDSDGSFGIEFTAHAFRQISERLEELAMGYPVIHHDVFKDGSTLESILLPSNLKVFVITLLADARKKGNFRPEPSNNNNGGVEYRYTINMNKWSNEKMLQFVAIVEDNFIKTGFFNWVKE